MKKITIVIALVLTFAATAISQSATYLAAMQTNLAQLDTTQKMEDFQKLANAFARIAEAEPKEWLPKYYNAYCNLVIGFMVSDTDPSKGQIFVSLAQTQVTEAQASNPTEVELVILQGYIYIGRIMENPMSKGAEYSPKCFQQIGKANMMDSNNPRANHVKGLLTMNMPEFYGGGAAKAKPILEKAAQQYETFKPATPLHPNWGKSRNAMLLQECKDQTTK